MEGGRIPFQSIFTLSRFTPFEVACVMTNTEATEAIDPKKETIELQPVLISGYIIMEIMEKARPSMKKVHIKL